MTSATEAVLLLDEPWRGGVAEAERMVEPLSSSKEPRHDALVEHDMDAVFALPIISPRW